MSNEHAMTLLHEHTDPKVREAAQVLEIDNDRRKRILALIRESLAQLRLDLKYIAFDLEATRRERDALKGPK